MHYKRTLMVVLVSACLLLHCGAETERDPEPVWYRALNLSVPSNARFEPFEIVGVGSEPGNHIVGRFFYFNYRPQEKAPVSVTISGSRKNADGTFWPRVTAQVAIKATGPWTTVGIPSAVGESTSLSIISKPKEEQFFVNLEIFRPMIGKVEYGRVVLETGEAAVFGLEVLVPPKVDREQKSEKHNK